MLELEQKMVPLLGKSEDLLRVYELKQLDKAVKDLIIFDVTQGRPFGTPASASGD